MDESGAAPALERFERALAALESEPYALTLFVSGASGSSGRAIANIRQICDVYLPGRHQLRIVDLNQEPEMAVRRHVLATPTLTIDHPPPSRMLVGDMSDHGRILSALNVPVSAATAATATPMTPTTPGDEVGR